MSLFEKVPSVGNDGTSEPHEGFLNFNDAIEAESANDEIAEKPGAKLFPYTTRGIIELRELAGLDPASGNLEEVDQKNIEVEGKMYKLHTKGRNTYAVFEPVEE